MHAGFPEQGYPAERPFWKQNLGCVPTVPDMLTSDAPAKQLIIFRKLSIESEAKSRA